VRQARQHIKKRKERLSMPIKGITEVVRLPRLGKIRLGIKKEGDGGCLYPSPTDYFVCPDEVKKIFGEKPKELRIMFPTEDSEQWASQYLRCYSESGNLICRGDGETALVKVETKNREPDATTETLSKLLEIPCNPDRCPCYRQGYCRRVMNLQFLLPDCPGFGVYQLDTSSYHAMKNINSTIALLRGICQRVSMIPLSLKLVEQLVQPAGFDKIAYVLSLTCPYSLVEIQRYAQVPPGQALLPPPDGEAPDDLFPRIKQAGPEPAEHTPTEDEELLELWAKAKSRVYRYDIQDSQIADWFARNCRITIRLRDFEAVTPPARLTVEALSMFCHSVDCYTG
jgi:hypothetical protein